MAGRVIKRLCSQGIAALLRLLILLYRYSLSFFIGGRCRFTPTCSVYADEALCRYGAVRGGKLAVKRLCRCHPWGGEGHDPVPDLGEEP